jgi:hypothetical protein
MSEGETRGEVVCAATRRAVRRAGRPTRRRVIRLRKGELRAGGHRGLDEPAVDRHLRVLRPRLVIRQPA